jgi:hypothetical protein
MSAPPESIEVGQCYLTEDGRVRKVMRLLPDGRIRYRYRGPAQQTMALRDAGPPHLRLHHRATRSLRLEAGERRKQHREE